MTGGLAGLAGAALLPAQACGAPSTGEAQAGAPSTAAYRFRVGRTELDPDGRQPVRAVTVNGAMPGTEGPLHERLSDREFEVFQMLVAGHTVTDIAAKLNLSGKTVSTHKARLMEKLGVDNQADLVRYAMKHGLSDPG